MDYSKDKTHAFTVEKMGLDINGNTVRKLTFFKTGKFDNELQEYKITKTNEAIENLTPDRVIDVWGR